MIGNDAPATDRASSRCAASEALPSIQGAAGLARCSQPTSGPVHGEVVRDPHLYPGTFQKEPGYPEERQFIQAMQEEWSKWGILQDDPNEATVSVVELLDGWEELEAGEIDYRSVISSVASQKCTKLVLHTPGRPAMGRNLLVDFQLVNFK